MRNAGRTASIGKTKVGAKTIVEEKRHISRLVSPGVLCLLAICVLDTLFSAWVFHRQLAVEWNPLLRPYAEAGFLPFVGMKSLTFVPCAIYMEWFRRRQPHVAGRLVWGACAAYLAVYALTSAAQLLRPA